MSDNPQNEESATLPEAKPEVKGIVDFEETLQQKDKAYQGMQRRYNSVYEEKVAMAAENESLAEKIARLENEKAELLAKTSTFEEQVQNLASEKEEVSGKFTKTQLEKDMWQQIAKDFPEVGGIVENLGLTPKESPEATAEMLSGLSTAIAKQAQSASRSSISELGAQTAGSVGKPPDLTRDQLRKKAAEAAGTPEYEKLSAQYYAKVQEDKDFPIPKSGPYDHLI